MFISIHSPHARGDAAPYIASTMRPNFNPLPSCEGRPAPRIRVDSPIYFNPLPSCEGRPEGKSYQCVSTDFNPLPSCEGRQNRAMCESEMRKFQSTPLMRGETLNPCARLAIKTFQSAPLMRGETRQVQRAGRRHEISIRSPHARGDECVFFNALHPCDFNPLPSCEGRHHKPPKIHPDLRQLTQQNHDTPLFGALQAPFCGAEPDIRGAKRLGKP